MIRKYWLSTCLLLLLLVSLALNLLLYRFVEAQYRDINRVRLDPTSERRFAAANLALEPPGPGMARVVFFGDSRIAYWENMPEVPDSQILNRGRGGETTRQMLLRLDQDVIALAPDVVVLEAGVNDLKAIGVFPNRAEQIVESLRRNFERMIARMQGAGIRVVVMTILPAGNVPLYRRSLWSERTREEIQRFNDWLRSTDYSDDADYSDNTNNRPVVVDCDPVIAEGRRTKAEYQLDMLHVNALGYEALNALMEPLLARLVRASGRRN